VLNIDLPISRKSCQYNLAVHVVGITCCLQIMQGSVSSDPVVETDVFLSDATVIEQPADGTCLYHALSYCLANSEIFLESYSSDDGFQLRSTINEFIKVKNETLIYLSPSVRMKISDAVHNEGYSCEEYFELMSRRTSWGGAIEISIVAEIFSVNVCIFVPADAVTSQRKFKLLAMVRCSLPDTSTKVIYILYRGYNHYVSLVDVVYEMNNFDPPSSDIGSSGSAKIRRTEQRDFKSQN
jgi:OTU-like cysteine protease